MRKASFWVVAETCDSAVMNALPSTPARHLRPHRKSTARSLRDVIFSQFFMIS